MYLKKFNFILDDKNKKFFFNNFYPFSVFKTSKKKNDFLKQINKYKEEENNCISLFGIKKPNTKSNNNRNKKKANKLEKTLSNSSLSKSLKDIFILKKLIKKNSLPTVNPININFNLFPNIQRRLKKFKTNLSLNTNNINNNQSNNLLLKNICDYKTISSTKNLNKLNNSPFITEITEKNTNNYISNSVKNIYELNELLNSKKILNDKFTYNKSTSINNNYQKTLSLEQPILYNNQYNQKSFSNKILNNIKSLSILNSPLNNRKKTNIYHSLSENKLFSSNNNSSKKDSNRNNDTSSLRNLNLSEELKSSINEQSTNPKNILNKKYNKQFNLMIKNKLSDLEEEINKDSKEQENTDEEYNSYIKYMIKKSKYIYNILEKNLTIKIPESDYNITKQKFFSKKNKNNYKRREFFKLKSKLKENEHKMFSLLNDYNYLKRKVYHKIDKLIGISA